MHEPECGRLAEVHKVKPATVASHIHSNDLLLLWYRPRTSFSVKLWKTSPGTGQNRTSRQPWSTYFLVLNFSFSLHSSSSLVVWWPLIEPFLPFNIYVCSLCQVGCPEVCFSPPPFCHSPSFLLSSSMSLTCLLNSHYTISLSGKSNRRRHSESTTLT